VHTGGMHLGEKGGKKEQPDGDSPGICIWCWMGTVQEILGKKRGNRDTGGRLVRRSKEWGKLGKRKGEDGGRLGGPPTIKRNEKETKGTHR